MRGKIVRTTAFLVVGWFALPASAQTMDWQPTAQDPANAATIADVRTALAAREHLDSGAIRVDSFGGTVRLSGSVPSRRHADDATQAAMNVDGVNHVLSELTAGPETVRVVRASF